MTREVALLRGVNVGGRNILPMAVLRTVVESVGHCDVETYIQSGNVVFTANDAGASRAHMAGELHEAISAAAGLDIVVIVRSAAEMAAAVERIPFDMSDPAKLYVFFLGGAPSAEAISKLEPERFAPDHFQVVGDHLYAFFPEGLGRSKFTNDYIERRLAVPATARNLNTVRRVLQMAQRAN
ncbi:MAG: hypothetical protein RLZZ623_3918 [Actinomycetota bacterium]